MLSDWKFTCNVNFRPLHDFKAEELSKSHCVKILMFLTVCEQL